jgi:hypothetical protein
MDRWVLSSLVSHFQVSRDLDESLSSLSRLGWVIFKSLETWMSHCQVRFFWWVTIKSLKTSMSHFQVSRDLDDGQMSTFKSDRWVLSSLTDEYFHRLLPGNNITTGATPTLQHRRKDDARPMHERKALPNRSPKKWLTLLRSSDQQHARQLGRRSTSTAPQSARLPCFPVHE